MERKIGEIKQVNGEWYQCVEQPEKYDKTVCALCAFQGNGNCELDMCSGTYRNDKKSVIFKKLEKVGEPFTVGRELCQHYKVFDIDNVCGDVSWNVHNYKAKTILIAIKQNKEEDMKTVRISKDDLNFLINKIRYGILPKHTTYDEITDEISNLFSVDDTKLSNSENIGKNLKPFNLEAAKSGKPVCTRDGRKARIICFDVKDDICPIIALVEKNDIEATYHYDKNGKNAYNKSELDLMMLPEKKEGWINVYKETDGEYYMDKIIHKTEKIAFDVARPDNYIGTVKIEWYE